MNNLRRFFFLFLIGQGILSAQTVTVNQLQQACSNNGIIVASASGITPPIIFTWYIGSTQITDTTNNLTDTLFNYSGQTIWCYATGNSGSAGTSFASPPFTYTAAITSPVCPATMGAATVNIIGGQAPYTVQWFDNLGNPAATGQNVSLPSGMSYSVTITDANGCTFGSANQWDSLDVIQQSPITVTTATTAANCTNGTASASATGGIGPYTYSWSNGQSGPQINSLLMGNYTVLVVDAQGCTGGNYVWVPQALTLTTNVVPTPATCLQNDGSAIAFGGGGIPPYTYLYSNGQTTQSASGLLAGNYSVRATDANGCFGTQYFYINASTPITVNYSSTQSSCMAPTGTASLAIFGGQAPYTVNWSTSPSQTGVSIANVSPGNYYFQVTDANGCTRNGSAQVYSISNLNASAYPNAATCPANNGSASISAFSNSGPLTYSWNTGATTATISNLSPGAYTCVIKDGLGCQLTKTANVLQVSPINLGSTITNASCIFRSDGKISLLATGGTPPYTYGCSCQQPGANLTNLSYGWYFVSVHDANGCYTSRTVYVGYNPQNDSCYCTVTGTVYHDMNGNCIKDVGETPVQNMLVKNNNTITTYGISNYAFTDAGGVYNFILPTGNYNIQEVIQYQYPPSSCQSNSNPLSLTAVSGCTYTLDFANAINPLHDIHLMRASLTIPVPGNSYVQQIIVQNDGTVAENNIGFGYAHDGQMPFVNSSGIGLTQPNAGLAPNWYAASNISLAPGQAITTLITYTVPTNIPLGTTVNFWDSAAYTPPMSNWLNDYTPWNNVNAFDTVVVGSYDPNMKEVSPKGVGPMGYITSGDTVLDYIVHFQNTGSYPANKIVVVDTLDPDLDWESLKPGYANSGYVASMDMNGVVSFTFNNINLPPESWNAIGSIGMFTYSIHTKKNLPVGTQFKNRAAIFFDYNAPVYTNTTVNTINNSIGISTVKSKNGQMLLYPNPASENYIVKVNVKFEGSAVLEIYSMDGALVSSVPTNLKTGENTLGFSVNSLTTGLYIVRMNNGAEVNTCKLSVMK